MTLYTRTGDEGETSLQQGVRVAKDAPRIEACGAVDELNSLLGLARAEAIPGALDEVLGRLQGELFELGAQLTRPKPEGPGPAITAAHVARVEADIDCIDGALAPLAGFILPGGVRAAATLHLARAACRRAERRLVALAHAPGERVPSEALAYLNRVADLLFAVARSANQHASRPDALWRRPV
ncbi:MAG: cob(I)yrinic acid a,c-diamide adenosyltransferase [Pirellulales bacterium]|nr:cob(I)yrinic acid a,c-diamide adenosyltransferase [Pirellulales bacterium]